MNTVKSILKNSKFDGRNFPFSHMYSVWEIDEVSILINSRILDKVLCKFQNHVPDHSW